MFWSLRTDRRGLRENLFNLIFSVVFYVLFNLKYLLVDLSHNTSKTLIIYQFAQTVQKHQEAVSFCKSLCISYVTAVFCIKRVLTNFAKITENT